MEILGGNPFVVFTVIAAPAVLTNAAAVMSLTTSNRLARAIDRARNLVAEMGEPTDLSEEIKRLRLQEIEVAHQRAVLLIRAIASYQFAFGGFALATLLALIGAALGLLGIKILNTISLLVVLLCIGIAVGFVLRGAVLVVRESTKAYVILRMESEHVLSLFPKYGKN